MVTSRDFGGMGPSGTPRALTSPPLGKVGFHSVPSGNAPGVLSRRDSVKLARRLNAGMRQRTSRVPKGRLKRIRLPIDSVVPPGLKTFSGSVPGVETPGYSQCVPPGPNAPLYY